MQIKSLPSFKYFTHFLVFILIYLSYHLLSFLSCLVINSFITFLHLLLSHSFNVIEEWIVHNYWKIIFLSKILAAWPILHFIKINYYENESIKDFFISRLKFPDKRLFIFLIYLLSFLFVVERPLFKESEVRYGNLFDQTLGLFSWFFLNFIILKLLYQKVRVTQFKEKAILSLVIFLGGLLELYIISPYKNFQEILLFNVYFFFFLMAFVRENDRIIDSLFYFLLFIIPYFVLLGNDPIWKDSYSIAQHHLGNRLLFIFVHFVGLFYYKFGLSKSLLKRSIASKNSLL